ncbi:MAG: xylan 1,4-beta-xylosidase, partial [Dysgonamonadaceae bacterium]|nr:xylan 1,4-beta-xylosidase [Dysgonamonadaceae bacterium]
QFKFNESNKGRFYYSFDNITYTPLAPEFELKYTYDFFVAPRFGLFNFATQSLGGYVDIDWFTTEETFTEDTFYDGSFAGYSEAALTPVALNTDVSNLTMLMGTNKTVRMLATFGDGRTEDVTTRVQVENTNPGVIKFVNGQLIALKEGIADITATFEGALGNPVTAQFQVTSTLFPLTNELFNARIFGEGTFDETNKKLTLTQYGFGGWEYSNGMNLSNYRFLVIKLKQRPASNVDISFRIFDQPSYWTTCTMYDWKALSSSEGKTLQVDLQNMNRPVSDSSEERVEVNLSRIYRVGFWVSANTSLYIDDVYLDGIIDDTAINDVLLDSYDPNEIVDVYSIMGIKMKSKVMRKDATNGLPTGIYIVGRQKVVIKR